MVKLKFVRLKGGRIRTSLSPHSKNWETYYLYGIEIMPSDEIFKDIVPSGTHL